MLENEIFMFLETSCLHTACLISISLSIFHCEAGCNYTYKCSLFVLLLWSAINKLQAIWYRSVTELSTNIRNRSKCMFSQIFITRSSNSLQLKKRGQIGTTFRNKTVSVNIFHIKMKQLCLVVPFDLGKMYAMVLPKWWVALSRMSKWKSRLHQILNAVSYGILRWCFGSRLD